MCICATGKNGSDRLLGSRATEQNAKWMWNATFRETQCFYVATVNFKVSICTFTRVLVKKQLGSWQRQLGKTAVIKVGAYIVSMDRKTTIYGLEAGKIVFF